MTQSKQKSQEIQIKSDFLASTLNFNNLDLIWIAFDNNRRKSWKGKISVEKI